MVKAKAGDGVPGSNAKTDHMIWCRRTHTGSKSGNVYQDNLIPVDEMLGIL